MRSANQGPPRPRTREQKTMLALGVILLAVLIVVFVSVGLGALAAAAFTGAAWRGPMVILDPNEGDARRQRWIKALASPKAPAAAVGLGWLGLGDPDADPAEGVSPWWPPERVSSWWAIVVGLACAGADVVLGFVDPVVALAEQVGWGRAGLGRFVIPVLSLIGGYVTAQMLSSAHRRTRHQAELSPVLLWDPDLVRRHAKGAAGGAAAGFVLGGFAGFRLLGLAGVGVGAAVAVVAFAIGVTRRGVAEVVDPWAADIATREDWQTKWAQLVPSAAPPVWHSTREQPADPELEPTHVMNIFNGTPGVPFETYGAPKVVEGLRAMLGTGEVLISQLPAVDAGGQPIPGGTHPSGFVVTHSIVSGSASPHMDPGVDPETRRFHLRRVVTEVFMANKLGRPQLVGAPRVMTTPDSAGICVESQWWLAQGVSAETVVAAADVLAEKLGASWVRVGQRANPFNGQRSDLVSIVVADDPTTWTLIPPIEPTLRVLDGFEIEATMLGARIGRPQSVTVRRIATDDPQIRRVTLVSADASTDALVKNLSKLEARLGTLVPEGVPSGHRIDTKALDLWWFPDGFDPDAHLDTSLPVKRRLPSARAALCRAMTVKGLGIPAIVDLDVIETASGDALRAEVLLPEGVSHKHLLEMRGPLAEELRAQDLVVSRIPVADLPEGADAALVAQVEQKYAVIHFAKSALDVIDTDATDEIREGRWDSWWGHPKVRVVDDAGATPRLLEVELLPGDVHRHHFTKVGGFTIDEIANRRDAVKELLGVEYLMINYRPSNRFWVDVAAKDPIPTMAPLPRRDDNLEVSSTWNKIPFGANAAGEAVTWDLKMAPHALICGATGSGKSIQLQVLLYGAMLRGFRVHMADPVKDGADFRWAQEWCESFITTVEGTAAMLDRIYETVKSQKKIRSQYEVGSWYDLPEEVRPRPQMVIIDEFFSTITKEAGKSEETEARNECKEMILDIAGRLAREARAAGVHLAFVAQRPDASVMKGEMRFNLGCRVLIGKANKTDVNMTLRTPEAYAVELIQPPGSQSAIKGRGVLDVEGSEASVFQGFYDGDLEGLKADLRALDLETFDHTHGDASAAPPVDILEW